jgi:multiple sugar transport system substrate-binding protein
MSNFHKEEEMKKVVFSLVMVAVLLLTACAGKTAGTTGGKTELSFMMWGDPAELTVWNQIVADFQAANPNITVSVEVSDWDSYWTKLKTLLAAKTPPDMFAIDAPLYLDYQSKGVLLNLKPYLDANPGMLDGLYPQTLQAYQTPQGYFGLPRDFQTIVLFYNKAMFDKAGLAYPTADWTWDDLRAAARKLTLDTNGDGKTDQYGFSFDMWDMEPGYSEAIWSYGGDIISADHTKTLLGEPAARQAWQLLYDMTFVDKSVPDSNTSGQYGGDTFLAGVSAMTPLGHWVVPGYADANLKFDAAPMPKGPAGRFTSVNSAGFVIAKGTKHPDQAFTFLKFVLSTAGQTRLAELGFACPVLKSIAESPAFLNQKIDINQQVFLDALQYAHMKPVFKGYDEWASAVGDGMAPVWRGEADLNKTLDEVVVAADAVLAKNK